MDEDPELETAVRELADTLQALRSELREPPRGPLGLPRPPPPRELLRLTEQYTIPAIVAVLETNVRLLELLAAAIRVADGRPLDGAVDDEGLLAAGRRTLGDASREGAGGLAAASRATLERLDDALADLQEAADGGAPDDPEVQRLLSEARALRAEVDDRLADATAADAPVTRDNATGPGTDDADESPSDESGAGGPVQVDVEEELDTLRRQADRPSDDPDDGAHDDGDDADAGTS